MRGALAAVAAAGVLAGSVLTGAPAVAAPAAAPASNAATVRLAGPLSRPAPDAEQVQSITIPVTITNTGTATLQDITVSSLRSAPITTGADLETALGGAAIEESESTKPGPQQDVPGTLAPGASRRFDYTVDSSNDPGTGICLCFLGVYALDVLVTAADEPDGDRGLVARTQTYLPSLLGVSAKVQVGWLWPLLDRPHRLGTGTVFADDALATSVAAGGRLDRALDVVEQVDAAEATQPGVTKSMLLLLDPELLDELVTMASGRYTVAAADGKTSTVGTGSAAAAAWLARLEAVLPRHDVRTTPPADPDVVGLSARSVGVQAVPDTTSAARVAAYLRLAGGALPAHDLAWPVENQLDAASVAALAAAGATRIVTTADTDDDGAVAAVAAGAGDPATPVLLADPELRTEAGLATGLGQANADALQRLVVTAAMTSVEHSDDSRFVFVVPPRDLDVAPAAATRAVLATTSLGRPTSPVAALASAGTGTTRSDLLAPRASAPPPPLDTALAAAAAAHQADATIRATVVSGADTVVGDLRTRLQWASSNSWVGDDADSARWTAALDARTTALTGAVQVVVRSTGSYSLASADAPLLLTVSNALPVPVRVRVEVAATTRSNGFRADSTEATVGALSRQTINVPTTVTRSGRFDVAVTLRTTAGAQIGTPAQITVTSTAVGAVGQIVTFGAGALLLLALVLRGARLLMRRSRAGSGGTGADADDARAEDRPGGQPTVPATPT